MPMSDDKDDANGKPLAKEKPARSIAWCAAEGTSIEHLTLAERSADGVVVGVDDDGQPFRFAYELAWDDAWRVHSVRLSVMGAQGSRGLALKTDGNGHWFDAGDQRIADLSGAIDVDLSASPFTNTFPIRRLGLKKGASAEIKAVYVAVPGLALSAVTQRYTNLGPGADGKPRWRYEGFPAGFSADLTIDAEGLVTDYPGLFRRL
jgi:hypothetical protein